MDPFAGRLGALATTTNLGMMENIARQPGSGQKKEMPIVSFTSATVEFRVERAATDRAEAPVRVNKRVLHQGSNALKTSKLLD